jgi:hypothetical protein
MRWQKLNDHRDDILYLHLSAYLCCHWRVLGCFSRDWTEPQQAIIMRLVTDRWRIVCWRISQRTNGITGKCCSTCVEIAIYQTKGSMNQTSEYFTQYYIHTIWAHENNLFQLRLLSVLKHQGIASLVESKRLTKASNQRPRSGNSGYYIHYHMNCNGQHLIAIKVKAAAQ